MARRKKIDINNPLQAHDAIMRTMIQRAIQGDTQAARLVLSVIDSQCEKQKTPEIIIINNTRPGMKEEKKA